MYIIIIEKYYIYHILFMFSSYLWSELLGNGAHLLGPLAALLIRHVAALKKEKGWLISLLDDISAHLCVLALLLVLRPALRHIVHHLVRLVPVYCIVCQDMLFSNSSLFDLVQHSEIYSVRQTSGPDRLQSCSRNIFLVFSVMLFIFNAHKNSI